MKRTKLQHKVASGKIWKLVKTEQPWRPGEGEILIGTFLGFRSKSGSHGDYSVAVIRAGAEIWHASGTILISCLESVSTSTEVRIEFLGLTKTANGHSMKLFNVYTSEAG